MQKPLPPQNSTWSRTRKTKILAWKNHSCEPVSVSKTFVQSMHLSHTKISLYVTIWHNYPNGGTEDQKHPPLLAPPQSSSAPPQSSSSSSCLKPTPIFFYTFCSACMGCFSFSFFFFICCVFLPSFTFSAPISTTQSAPISQPPTSNSSTPVALSYALKMVLSKPQLMPDHPPQNITSLSSTVPPTS